MMYGSLGCPKREFPSLHSKNFRIGQKLALKWTKTLADLHIFGEICPRSDPDIAHMWYYLGPLKLKYRYFIRNPATVWPAWVRFSEMEMPYELWRGFLVAILTIVNMDKVNPAIFQAIGSNGRPLCHILWILGSKQCREIVTENRSVL